jgi:hypothetical protein
MEIVIHEIEMLIHREQNRWHRYRQDETSMFAMVIVNREHEKQCRTIHWQI